MVSVWSAFAGQHSTLRRRTFREQVSSSSAPDEGGNWRRPSRQKRIAKRARETGMLARGPWWWRDATRAALR